MLTPLQVMPLGLCIVIQAVAAHPGYGDLESASQWWSNDWDPTYEEPSISASELNVTAVTGDTALLPCTVHHLKDKTVSWIRARDLTVIAVDLHTVTTDPRFKVRHAEDSEEWVLAIQKVRMVDAGTYDCQVNTHPKISSRIHMSVLPDHVHSSRLDYPVSDTLVPSLTHTKKSSYPQNDEAGVSVAIQGHTWFHVEKGATMRLICEARGKGLVPPAHGSSQQQREQSLVTWTLDNVPVTVLFKPSKVQISESWRSNMVLSELLLLDAQPDDAGSYACSVPGTTSPVVTVAVLYDYSGPQHYVGVTNKGEYYNQGHQQLKQENEKRTSSEGIGRGSKVVVISGALLLFLLLFHFIVCLSYVRRSS